jgi:hypothetical protein
LLYGKYLTLEQRFANPVVIHASLDLYFGPMV